MNYHQLILGGTLFSMRHNLEINKPVEPFSKQTIVNKDKKLDTWGLSGLESLSNVLRESRSARLGCMVL